MIFSGYLFKKTTKNSKNQGLSVSWLKLSNSGTLKLRFLLDLQIDLDCIKSSSISSISSRENLHFLALNLKS
eukprot:snap_masked-scaffold_62-processed-gene-0.34-mRNA-1 protein AED:1.00 eAED:1.00 QI:0/0/0/0/1/1/3/0/71